MLDVLSECCGSDLIPSGGARGRLWIFGYGSLIWKPGFTYQRRRVGLVRGYVRRFWQGNTSHCGTTNHPGRVATLVPSVRGETWGVAYEVVGSADIRAALAYLVGREVDNGYAMRWCRFHSGATPGQGAGAGEGAVRALAYMATPGNPLWVGGAGGVLEEALEVWAAPRGPAGHNVEYVMRVADFIALHGLRDPYVERLQSLITALIRGRGGLGDGAACLCAAATADRWCYCGPQTTASASADQLAAHTSPLPWKRWTH